ncbi:MAG TPA: sulfotransferase [Dokdonella sp.]
MNVPASQTRAPSPTAAAAAPFDRLDGLSPATIDLLRQTAQHLRSGKLQLAEQTLLSAEALAPRHVEVQRTRSLLLNHAGRHIEARDLIRKLLLLHPDEPALLNDLGGALRGCGDYEGAFATWQRACDLQPDFAIGWFNLARNLKAQAWIEESLPALERTVALAPENLLARTMYADVLVNLGHFGEARTQYLDVLQRAPNTGSAWWGLASIKSVRLSDAETEQLTQLLQSPGIAETDRIAMGCTLAKAHEDAGRYAQAHATLTAANARMRQLKPWSAAKFHAMVEQTLAAFTQPHAHAEDAQLGAEVIFIVSLPRSGSTLTEQILAAHPDVEGASELPDLAGVLREESQRRRVEFPHWVADASAADWTRLGRAYLARTARWRRRRPLSTDKMPNNWFFIGAALAMLPGARIVNCRRDPVETCWSCYKQLFSNGNEFSYDLGDLAAFWHDYDRAMQQWHALAPGRIRDQVYERLVADAEPEVRALLDFCGLPFDEACLRFHEAARSVRTASASQVREPLRRDTARSAHYGDLLAPLRAALARAG